MSGWKLPKALNVGGREYPIRYQFGAVLDILAAYNDPELDSSEKTEAMLTILFPAFPDMPEKDIPEAMAKGFSFIDCGQKDDGKPKPRLIDWEQDAAIIIPAVNHVAGRELRLDPDLHWWTFWGYYMSIGESLLSSVIHIRSKQVKHKKLDKWEEEFYRENRELIDLKKPETEAVRAEKESILSWFDKER